MIDQAIEFLKALSALAWPAIFAIVLWILFPDLKSIVASRSFSIKIAGMEVSAQDATEQIRAQIDDLQKQVIALKSGQEIQNNEPVQSATHRDSPDFNKRLLWVDDKPESNALEIAQLQNRGFEIVLSLSTNDALQTLNKNRGFSAIISDMGRREDGHYQAQAGLVLLNAIRRAGYKTPFLVYSSQRYAERNRGEVIEAGGDGATASAVELLEWAEQVTVKDSH